MKCNPVGFTKVVTNYLITQKKAIPIPISKIQNIDYSNHKCDIVVVTDSMISFNSPFKAKKIITNTGVVGIYSFINPIRRIDSFIKRIFYLNDGSLKKDFTNKINIETKNIIKTNIFEEYFEYFFNYNMWVLQKNEALNMCMIQKRNVPLMKSLSIKNLDPELEEFKNKFIKENLSDIKDRYNDINKILQKEKEISLEFIDELNRYKHG